MRFSRLFRRTHSGTTARVTGHFWLLVAVIVALFLEAYMHNFNIVYVTLFFLVGFGIVSEFMGRGNVARLEARLLQCGRIFAKTPSPYRVRVANPSEAPSYAVALSNGDSDTSVGRVGAHDAAIATLSVRFGRRGSAVLPPSELVSFYPLPHLRFGKVCDPRREVVVLPEPKGVSLEELLSRNRSPSGERDDFEGIRRYERGDTASLIYWPSVAKGGRMLSKQFRFEEATRRLRFRFRDSGDDDESRLSQLTLWVLECEARGLPFVIEMPFGELDSRKEGIDAVLETLARY